MAKVASLHVGKTPDFVALNPLGRDVADLLMVEARCGRPRIHKELGYRIDGNVAHARDRAHGRTLAEHCDNLDSLRYGQLVHNRMIARMLTRSSIISFT